MTLRNVQVVDRVLAKVAGHKFEAIVEAIDDPEVCSYPISIRPVGRWGAAYRYLAPHEVVRVIERRVEAAA